MRPGGRATRNRQGRPNYKEVPIEDIPSPTGKVIPTPPLPAPPTVSDTGAQGSKYFPRQGEIGETRRRRVSHGSGTSRDGGSVRNGNNANGDGQARAPQGFGSGRRSTRSHAAEEEEDEAYDEAGDEEDAQPETEDFGTSLPLTFPSHR